MCYYRCFGVFLLNKPADNRVVIKFSTWGSQSEIALLKPLIQEFEKRKSRYKDKTFAHSSKLFSKTSSVICL